MKIEYEAAKQVKKVEPYKQKMRQTILGEIQKWDKYNLRATTITKLMGKWISANLLPYSVVESSSFKEMVNEMQPHYDIPGRHKFTRKVIPNLAKELMNTIKFELNVSDCDVLSFTTDLWSSAANSAFISITVHYITSNF